MAIRKCSADFASIKPHHVDGIFGEIIARSTLHTLRKKTCSDVSLLTCPFFNYSDIRNIEENINLHPTPLNIPFQSQ